MPSTYFGWLFALQGRGGALREMRNQASSTERAPANTKALPEAASESSLSTLPVLPDVSSPERTEKKVRLSGTTIEWTR